MLNTSLHIVIHICIIYIVYIIINMKFVADIVRGVKISCGAILHHKTNVARLLHITSNFAPHETIACHVEQFCHVVWRQYMLPYCGSRCFDNKSILLQFTNFCVEQKLFQTYFPWSKNYKFHVWLLCNIVYIYKHRYKPSLQPPWMAALSYFRPIWLYKGFN